MPRPPLIEKAIASLLGTPGETDRSLRRAVFERVRAGKGEVPEELAALMETIADRPWSVTDGDISCVRETGYSEEQLYELILAAAAGAGARRLDAGLRALEEAQ
jgi:hypothetical protein